MIGDGYGCPAHAGIDLEQVRLVGDLFRLPRTRGDRPAVEMAILIAVQVAPHTRG